MSSNLDEMTKALMHANKHTAPGTGKKKMKMPAIVGKKKVGGKMMVKKKPAAGKHWM